MACTTACLQLVSPTHCATIRPALLVTVPQALCHLNGPKQPILMYAAASSHLVQPYRRTRLSRGTRLPSYPRIPPHSCQGNATVPYLTFQRRLVTPISPNLAMASPGTRMLRVSQSRSLKLATSISMLMPRTSKFTTDGQPAESRMVRWGAPAPPPALDTSGQPPSTSHPPRQKRPSPWSRCCTAESSRMTITGTSDGASRIRTGGL